LPLTWLVGIFAIVGLSMWVASALLASRPGYRRAVQIAMILAAVAMMLLGFSHSLRFRGH
jgi:hypothetical protein